MKSPNLSKPPGPLDIDHPCEQTAQQLNDQCRCIAIDKDALRANLVKQGNARLYQMLMEDRPHLFADVA
ncbi:MAG: hypothetical protein LUP96_06820, partial [Methylococcaceae bacterium]|nr:hypothetical protein [Methylococcaceae bacterium]